MRSRWWLCLPVVLAIVAHMPSLSDQFVWDDVRIARWTGSPDANRVGPYTRDYGHVIGADNAGYFRPLLLVIARVLAAIPAPAPFVFHTFSLLVFSLTVLLFTLLCVRFVGKERTWLAILAGAGYACHPVRTEVVSLFMSLPDLLVELAGVGLVGLFLRALEDGQTPSSHWTRFGRPVIVLVVAASVGLAKESAYIVVGAIAGTALVLGLTADRMTLRRTALVTCSAAGLGGLALAMALRAAAGIPSQHSVGEYLGALFTTGAGRAVTGLLFSIRDLVLPQYATFCVALHSSTGEWIASLAVVLFCAATGAAVLYLIRQRKAAALVIAWFGAGTFGLMLTVSAGLPYSQRYIALAPMILAVVLIVRALLDRFAVSFASSFLARVTALSAFCSYLIFCGLFTWESAVICRTPVTFFTHMVAQDPDASYPRACLAKTAVQYLPPRDAESAVREWSKRSPVDGPARPFRIHLLKEYLGRNENAYAIRFAEYCVSLDPHDADAMALKAVAQAQAGNREDAIQSIEAALKEQPTNVTYRTLATQIRAGK